MACGSSLATTSIERVIWNWALWRCSGDERAFESRVSSMAREGGESVARAIREPEDFMLPIGS